MRMVLALLTSLRSFSSFWHGIARKRSLLVLRASVDIKSTEKSATLSRAFCTFFPQKGTQKSPADACAYSVPANVRNGRLFAGLQANRPRFLPLLAGTSFDGSASGRNRSRRNAARSWRNSQIGYAESCHRPWKRVSTAAFSLGAEREQPPARESDMRMVLVLLTSLRSFSSFWHGIARKRSLLVLRASVATKR